MTNNNITAEGVASLADALRTNSTLTTLILNANSIGEGGNSLAEVLKTNSTLTSLGFSETNITLEGVLALIDALQNNTVFNDLDLVCNYLNAEAVNTIVDKFIALSRPINVYLVDNDLTDEEAETIALKLQNHPGIVVKA